MNKKVKIILTLSSLGLLLTGCGNTSDITSITGDETTTSESTNSNSSTIDEVSQYYADIDESLSGTSLKSKLQSLLNSGSLSFSYDWVRFMYADQSLTDTTCILAIYSRKNIAKTEKATGSNSGWNREHTFPQSKLGDERSTNDNHIVFASDKTVNAARGNLKLGKLSGSGNVKDRNGDSTPCIKSSKLFDPNSEARGEVARATMYAACMYNLNPTTNFESIETMLEWHLTYAPKERDIQRNNRVYDRQHNRNPFVDHPEYGCKIWGSTNSATKKLCGM